MHSRKKAFLFVAVPFVVVALALSWFVSMMLSMGVTVLGLLFFFYVVTRPQGRSLANTPCAFCARNIIVEHQGDFCAGCDKAIHASCMGEHRMSAHADASDQPFR